MSQTIPNLIFNTKPLIIEPTNMSAEVETIKSEIRIDRRKGNSGRKKVYATQKKNNIKEFIFASLPTLYDIADEHKKIEVKSTYDIARYINEYNKGRLEKDKLYLLLPCISKITANKAVVGFMHIDNNYLQSIAVETKHSIERVKAIILTMYNEIFDKSIDDSLEGLSLRSVKRSIRNESLVRKYIVNQVKKSSDDIFVVLDDKKLRCSNSNPVVIATKVTKVNKAA